MVALVLAAGTSSCRSRGGLRCPETSAGRSLGIGCTWSPREESDLGQGCHRRGAEHRPARRRNSWGAKGHHRDRADRPHCCRWHLCQFGDPDLILVLCSRLVESGQSPPLRKVLDRRGRRGCGGPGCWRQASAACPELLGSPEEQSRRPCRDTTRICVGSAPSVEPEDPPAPHLLAETQEGGGGTQRGGWCKSRSPKAKSGTLMSKGRKRRTSPLEKEDSFLPAPLCCAGPKWMGRCPAALLRVDPPSA